MPYICEFRGMCMNVATVEISTGKSLLKVCESCARARGLPVVCELCDDLDTDEMAEV